MDSAPVGHWSNCCRWSWRVLQCQEGCLAVIVLMVGAQCVSLVMVVFEDAAQLTNLGNLAEQLSFFFGIPPYLVAQLTPSILLPIHSLWRSRLTTWALHRCCILIVVKYKDVNLLIHNKFFTAIDLTSIKSLGIFVLFWLVGVFFLGCCLFCLFKKALQSIILC